MRTAHIIIAAVCDALESDAALADRVRRILGIAAPDEWLSLERAAEIAGGIEPRVISDDARRGRITIGHAGRAPMVRRSELDRWIESRGVVHRDTKPEKVTPKAEAQSAIARAAARWAR